MDRRLIVMWPDRSTGRCLDGIQYFERIARCRITHINGENGDFQFLRLGQQRVPADWSTTAGVAALDEECQGEFVGALYVFGWKGQLAWQYAKDGQSKLIPKTRHLSNHYHHLHVDDYSPTIEDI